MNNKFWFWLWLLVFAQNLRYIYRDIKEIREILAARNAEVRITERDLDIRIEAHKYIQKYPITYEHPEIL